ncbi:LCP family protein [Intestinibacillus sp. Marseille-P6563]|uniref:LCP family protein n=1 Tax=Intestinibacillus sp. Marseille-P6563 TaxID=2364792 RepID=UPI000F049900|nr:LCP family protein [Intestinibacillus sp. Marseille-P6563]
MSFRRLMRIVRRCLLLAVLTTLAITVGLFVYRFLFSYTYDNSLEGLSDEDLAVSAKPASGITNIALFGIDTRPDEPTRSDCMMVMSVNADTGTIKLISLMRDSEVEIEGHGTQKLCHAYSYGGPELAIKTINQTFDLNITDYAEVNFVQMANLIGEVGGVDIDVSEAERVEANKYIKEYYESFDMEPELIEEAGYQHLNGIQAMTYARIRKGGTGDDWGRVERQSIVLEAMFETVQDKSITELVAMMPRLLPYVTTSLKKSEMVSLAKGLFANGQPQMEHSRVPKDGEWEYGGSQEQYIVYDLDKAAQDINDYIYGDS